jgi:alkyl sulfatase BDS1-like metallo-beta-lactamase superfamily hydrolase
MKPFRLPHITVLASLLASNIASLAQTATTVGLGPKPATAVTASANRTVAGTLTFNDSQDFEEATRGLVATLPDPVIKNADGRAVWDASRFDFIHGDAPATVNPSLWRQEQLNNKIGLFKVVDGIYQIRGYDLANMTLIEGASGWIVIDTLLSREIAKKTLDFAMQVLGSKKPVLNVIYTHSHIDHFGGVRGVVDEADVKSGKVRIIAPEGFMDNAIAENVLAGNAMARRATYMFGIGLPANERQGVGDGLGKAVSTGVAGLIPPTDTISQTGHEMIVDGVRVVFMMAQGTEAPSEMMVYFPDKKALCLAEVATKHMHNVYTLRGAKARDALGWSKYINQTIDMFPEVEVAFASHHWPTWGGDRIRQFLRNQRDTYRFLNDETLHLANSGQDMDEIGNATFFPKGLATDSSSRGYYGSLSHNMRAVYNYYLGYYDGNPATLNHLPPVELAKRYVDAMGGEKAVLQRARKAFAAGDYRWATELLNRLVFADPKNQAARNLEADALEQLGYQSEAATWRNIYLVGAKELREGLPKPGISPQATDVVRGMTNELLFDFIAVRLNHQAVDGHIFGIDMVFTDSDEQWALELSNSVLNNTKGRVLKAPDLTMRLTRQALLGMLLQKKPLADLVQSGAVKVEGDTRAWTTLMENVQTFNPVFDIVTR